MELINGLSAVAYESLTYAFFLIFAGAALLASLALYSKQPIIVAYILLGACIGPYGLAWIQDIELLKDSGEIGIMFLLFLLGLDMQPRALLTVARKVTVVVAASSTLFAIIGYLAALSININYIEAIIVGVAMMFSSTIVAIKLLPTTVLHHKHTGELIIGILLLQDILAIVVLIILMGGNTNDSSFTQLLTALFTLPLLVAFAYAFVNYVLLVLINRFDRIQEYIFLLAIAWCLGLAEAAHSAGLSAEIGAFVAGLSLATSPIAQFIAISLKPLRDFFLILFFFSLGAQLNLPLLREVAVASLVLAIIMIAIKPMTFRMLLISTKEAPHTAWNVGLRLGQNSEFSLLIAYVATSSGLLSINASYLIQLTAIITFVLSSYLVIFKLPSPMAISEKLRRN